MDIKEKSKDLPLPSEHLSPRDISAVQAAMPKLLVHQFPKCCLFFGPASLIDVVTAKAGVWDLLENWLRFSWLCGKLNQNGS